MDIPLYTHWKCLPQFVEEVKIAPLPKSESHSQLTDQIWEEFPLDSRPIILDLKWIAHLPGQCLWKEGKKKQSPLALIMSYEIFLTKHCHVFQHYLFSENKKNKIFTWLNSVPLTPAIKEQQLNEIVTPETKSTSFHFS